MIPDLARAGARGLLFAMAAQAEYGPHLRARIRPLMTGVGPVEAAVSVTAALSALAANGALPDLVVSLGSAGSRTLEPAGIYQAISVGYRDMDASALGFQKGQTPFLNLPAQVPLSCHVPGIPKATLSTGAAVISGRAYDDVGAEMVDMESFAVLRACHLFGVPLVVLRGISDGQAELRQLDDWTEYLHVIDEKLALAVDRLMEWAAEAELVAR